MDTYSYGYVVLWKFFNKSSSPDIKEESTKEEEEEEPRYPGHSNREPTVVCALSKSVEKHLGFWPKEPSCQVLKRSALQFLEKSVMKTKF